MGDYKDGQVVETFNSILKRMLPYLGSMNEPRQAGILNFTSAASNTTYRDGVRGKMEEEFGEENLGLDVWRRFCDLRTLNVASIAATAVQTPAPLPLPADVVMAEPTAGDIDAATAGTPAAGGAGAAAAAAATSTDKVRNPGQTSRQRAIWSANAAAAANPAAAPNPNLVLLSDSSDGSGDDMQTEELKQRIQNQASRQAAVGQMMNHRLQELEQNRALESEKNDLQLEYDVFVRFVEGKNGGKEGCDGHLKVFCGYMRLNSEDKYKALYKKMVRFVFITIRLNTVGDTLPSSNFSCLACTKRFMQLQIHVKEIQA